MAINNSKNPLVSIITVVYNAEEFLEETILSVLNQDYKNIEYIIIDGGSTDLTLDIIKKYHEKIDIFVSEDDKGIFDAMNKGIGLANGEWLNFLNAGDVLCFDKFDWHKFKSDLQDSGADIIACGYIFKDIKSKTSLKEITGILYFFAISICSGRA